MDNKDWQIEDRQEPWEQSYYQTGSTRPPKNHRGVVAILLVVIIFLGGIISVLGLLNIRLFRQNNTGMPEDASFRFSNEETTEPVAPTDATRPTVGKENVDSY